jgi:glycosyltransferase involved in cell wall biosynthesis
MAESTQLFSIVVPVLNEEDVIAETYVRLNQILDTLGMPFEVVVVDNGSTDRTPERVAELCVRDPRWKYMRLSRNFGYQNSITAGMIAAQGDAIMVIDADLQDPPELIPHFVAKWKEGYDVVYGVREKRTGESRFRVLPTMLAMRFITWMSDEVKLPLHSADFRLISRRVRDAFALLPETSRYVRGMIHWLGFRQIGIPYVRKGRTRGYTKVNPLFLIGFTLNAVFSCSVKPLRLFSMLGLGALALACVLALHAMIVLPFQGEAMVSSTFLMLLFMMGVQSAGIGILGEYILRIHAQSRGRPLWLVDYTLNMNEDVPQAGLQGRVVYSPPIAPSAPTVQVYSDKVVYLEEQPSLSRPVRRNVFIQAGSVNDGE